MKYKVGDKVKLRTWEELEAKFGLDDEGDIETQMIAVVKGMKEYLGKTATINRIDYEDDTFLIEEDDACFWYNEECIDEFDRLEAYERVNQCETFEELAGVIRSLADEEGMIQGRTIKMDAERMARSCENFNSDTPPNVLTREFGIRQQAMYINYYSN